MGAIVRHCVGISLARCSSFSSSVLDHSTFLMDGSSHSYHRALHCFGVFLTSRDEIRAHCCGSVRKCITVIRAGLTFLPYFEMAALRISSSVLRHTPPLMMIRTMVGVWIRGERGNTLTTMLAFT